jgi:signal transduction histidine kinase
VGEYLCYGDGGKIKQVMSNLIDNAVKYTKEGTISVGLRHVSDESGVKMLEFSVKDTGVGIASETLPHLFEKFSRADDASKTNIIGTGLGLFVAKQIVDAHGGKIWAESAGKGKGATFFIRLYVSKGHDNVRSETATSGTAKITPIPEITSEKHL